MEAAPSTDQTTAVPQLEALNVYFKHVMKSERRETTEELPAEFNSEIRSEETELNSCS